MRERQYHEAKMSPVVSEWIHSQGFTPYAEVPFRSRTVDFVGLSDSFLIAVEMKTSLNHSVFMQAYGNMIFAENSYAAVSSKPKPKTLERAKIFGVGVLHIGNTVTVLSEPGGKRESIESYVTDMRQWLKRMTPGGTAGMPMIAGVGPAQSVFDAVAEYRKTHPNASWQEIFANVPNHYKHAKSMQCALSWVPFRRARIENKKRGTLIKLFDAHPPASVKE